MIVHDSQSEERDQIIQIPSGLYLSTKPNKHSSIITGASSLLPRRANSPWKFLELLLALSYYYFQSIFRHKKQYAQYSSYSSKHNCAWFTKWKTHQIIQNSIRVISTQPNKALLINQHSCQEQQILHEIFLELAPTVHHWIIIAITKNSKSSTWNWEISSACTTASLLLLSNLGDERFEGADERLHLALPGNGELPGGLLDHAVVQPPAPLLLQRLLVPERHRRHHEPPAAARRRRPGDAASPPEAPHPEMKSAAAATAAAAAAGVAPPEESEPCRRRRVFWWRRRRGGAAAPGADDLEGGGGGGGGGPARLPREREADWFGAAGDAHAPRSPVRRSRRRRRRRRHAGFLLFLARRVVWLLFFDIICCWWWWWWWILVRNLLANFDEISLRFGRLQAVRPGRGHLLLALVRRRWSRFLAGFELRRWRRLAG